MERACDGGCQPQAIQTVPLFHCDGGRQREALQKLRHGNDALPSDLSQKLEGNDILFFSFTFFLNRSQISLLRLRTCIVRRNHIHRRQICAEKYLLAMFSGGCKEQFLQLLNTLDITKVTSMKSLTCIFKSLGKLMLENIAEKCFLDLKTSVAEVSPDGKYLTAIKDLDRVVNVPDNRARKHSRGDSIQVYT